VAAASETERRVALQKKLDGLYNALLDANQPHHKPAMAAH